MKIPSWIAIASFLITVLNIGQGDYIAASGMAVLLALSVIPLVLIKFYQRLKVGIAADRR
jgi:hypothetical protein